MLRDAKAIASLWLLTATVTSANMGNSSAYAGLSYYFPNTSIPQRFDVRVDRKHLELVQRKVRDYRPSPSVYSDWTVEGPPQNAVAGLVRHWAEEYDWKAVEEIMNEDANHFAVTLPGNRNYTAPIPLHFVHEQSHDKEATPLLLIHGWSSTHQEWTKVIKPLVNNTDGRAFHIVAPDLPGYGFSPSPILPGLGPREIAQSFDGLMKQLGYSTYGIVSTDIGWPVAMWMTADVRESIIGHFTDFFLAAPNSSDLVRLANNQTTEEENAYLTASNAWSAKHAAYITVQTQKPQALAMSLTDSPVGTAAWLWDLKEACSDGYNYTYDEIITEAMLTWLQPLYGALKTYEEISKPELLVFPRTDVPTAVTQWGNIDGPFPDIAMYPLAPRSWVERDANVVYFERYEIGGHFPALTQPDLWVKDVRAFFSGPKKR